MQTGDLTLLKPFNPLMVKSARVLVSILCNVSLKKLLETLGWAHSSVALCSVAGPLESPFPWAVLSLLGLGC